MFRGIVGFEWRCQTRRWGFLAVAAAFFGIGFAFSATGFGPGEIALNSPYSIAQTVGMASLVAALAATVFCASAALRDPEHRMSEIVFATAVSRSDYLFGRFAGVVAALAAAFACLLPGMLVGTFAIAHDPQRMAPFAPLSYVAAFALLGLPNLLFVAAALYAIALATRSSLATYVGGALIYFSYWVAALFAGSPLLAAASPPSARALAIAALADPFGLSAFFATTRYWSVAERATRLLEPSGVLLANRALWLAATLLLLAIVQRRFAFRLPRGARDAGVGEAAVPRPRSAVPATAPRRGAGAQLRACASLTRFELRHALRGWALPTLLATWTTFVTIELVQSFTRSEFGSARLPATSLVLRELGEPLGLFGTLFVLYFAAELAWRERVAGMAELVDATPVSNAALLAGKGTALAVLLATLVLVTMLGALAFQLSAGWRELEPALYLSALAHLSLPLFLVALLGLVVQSVVPNRHLGLFASALLVLFWQRGALGGPEHPLLRYAGLPEVPYSDIAGFGPERLAFVWLGAYWSAFALLLAAAGCAFWRRGTGSRIGWRPPLLSATCGGSTRGAATLAALAAPAWMVLGALIFRQTNRWNVYRTPEEVEAWRAAYERAYRRLEGLPQPVPTRLSAEIDLHPEERSYEVKGRFLLVNPTSVPIDAVWVTGRRDLARLELRLDGHGATESDAEFGTHRFVLSPALPPGGTTELGFELAVRRRGVTAEPPAHDIVESGSFLLSPLFLPSIGYLRSYEIEDEDARRRLGLPLAPRAVTFEAAEVAGFTNGAPHPFELDVTITTAPDQVVVAPGKLVEHGEREGRAFFHYRTEGAISPIVALASGRYSVARRVQDGVAVEVYHHPTHTRNIEAILDAAARALSYCRREFGPYPFSDLRIVELPWSSPLAQRGTGFATPGTVFLLENAGFLTDRSDPDRVDVVTKRVAHEVAHQWWGHQLSPAPGPGAATLVETLARYTELRVLAELHGEAAIAAVLAFELDRYLAGRGRGEKPLATVENEAHVFYSKGALVMSAIRDRIGTDATNLALRGLLDAVRAGRQPAASELLDALVRGASESDRELISQWWNGVVLYDLSITSARVTDRQGGRLRLDIELAAKKSDLVDGTEREVALDEELLVALYADDPGVDGRGGAPLQVGRVRVRGDEHFSLDVDAAARFVLVDPDLLRPDRNRADNLREIQP
jgi:ABC-type transport system involved in multi-copper enzyme maturation permease subunit